MEKVTTWNDALYDESQDIRFETVKAALDHYKRKPTLAPETMECYITLYPEIDAERVANMMPPAYKPKEDHLTYLQDMLDSFIRLTGYHVYDATGKMFDFKAVLKECMSTLS